MDKYDELCERLAGYNPPDRTIDDQRQIASDIHDAIAAIRELKAKVAGMESRVRVAEELLADARQAASERLTRAERAEAERDAENAALRDAINDALPWMIKLGDYIGNGTQADPMGRCNAILKMRIAVEKRDD